MGEYDEPDPTERADIAGDRGAAIAARIADTDYDVYGPRHDPDTSGVRRFRRWQRNSQRG